nr:hypothetical protein BaRGS_010920 [Batillaria attramentaria]
MYEEIRDFFVANPNFTQNDMASAAGVGVTCVSKFLVGNLVSVVTSEKIRNEELWERAGQEPVAKQILRRKWGWIGHTLRKPASSTTHQGPDMEPAGEKEERPASQQLEAGH